MNAIFGDWRGAPITEDAPVMEAPVGQPCLYCAVPIKAGDVGQIMPMSEPEKTGVGYSWTFAPIHRDCLIEWVLGPNWREP